MSANQGGRGCLLWTASEIRQWSGPMTVGVLHLHLGVNGKQQILLLGWMQLSFPFSPSMLRFCPFEPDWKVWRVSLVEGNCYFSSLAFHRQGRRWASQAPRSTWKGSKKTGRGQGGLWTPTQQVRGSLKSTSQLLSPRPSLRPGRSRGLSHSCNRATHGRTPWRWERDKGESQAMSSQ